MNTLGWVGPQASKGSGGDWGGIAMNTSMYTSGAAQMYSKVRCTFIPERSERGWQSFHRFCQKSVEKFIVLKVFYECFHVFVASKCLKLKTVESRQTSNSCRLKR